MKPDEHEEDRLSQRLGQLKMQAPGDFKDRVMDRLPKARVVRQSRMRFSWSWPQGQWLTPALAGAAVAVLIVGALRILDIPGNPAAPAGDLVRISFEFHAPDAQSVSLAGSFNSWTPGEIKLTGPDRTGHWRTEISLPEGVHEYSFIVNGSEWVTDPHALAYQEDGFGSRNSLVTL